MEARLVLPHGRAGGPPAKPTLEECLPWAGECSPGTAATPAQEAGLTAECSRGTETPPAQETGMTVQDVEALQSKRATTVADQDVALAVANNKDAKPASLYGRRPGSAKSQGAIAVGCSTK